MPGKSIALHCEAIWARSASECAMGEPLGHAPLRCECRVGAAGRDVGWEQGGNGRRDASLVEKGWDWLQKGSKRVVGRCEMEEKCGREVLFSWIWRIYKNNCYLCG